MVVDVFHHRLETLHFPAFSSMAIHPGRMVIGYGGKGWEMEGFKMRVENATSNVNSSHWRR